MRGRIAQLMAGTLVALGLATAPVPADEVKQPAFSQDKASVKSRIENVRRLVNTSSGARRVEQGSAQANALRANAAKHLETAERLYAKGDMAGANDALQKATMEMFKAIRKVGTGKVGVDKLREDYQTKRKSLDALLGALERVAAEKGMKPHGAAQIRAKAKSADKLAAAGKLNEARKQLDQAYDAVTSEVEKLRRGDTLVRSLEFASKEEEYAYELDRNETHEMLVRLLLDDKKLDARAQAQVDSFIAEARVLRKKADGASKAKRFEEGIRLLEESTKQLVRAIRRAGVYIPG